MITPSSSIDKPERLLLQQDKVDERFVRVEEVEEEDAAC